MSRRAQALEGWVRRVFLWGSLRGALCVLGLLAVQGCAARGLSIDQLAADETLVTGSIGQEGAGKRDRTLLSDAMTVRNAVSAAIVDELPPSGLGWANAETGSRGTITAIAETRRDGVLCRGFDATRETFAGVHLFRGRACLGASGTWTTQAFLRAE